MRGLVFTYIMLCCCVFLSAASPGFAGSALWISDELPQWYKKGGITSSGEKAIEILKSSETNGIASSRYDIENLSTYLTLKTEDEAEISNINDQITQKLVLYMIDLESGIGRSRENIKKLSDEGERKSVLQAISRLIRQPDYNVMLDNIQTDNEQYIKLKKALSAYTALKNSQLIKTIALKTPLELGDEHEAIPQIRQNIKIINAAAKSTKFDKIKLEPGIEYDEALMDEVQQFQKITRLEADGVLNKRTVERMNNYADDGIAQIRFTMDKLRSETPRGGQKYIVVNVPEFQLYAYSAGKREFTMPIIVGQVGTQTPEFRNGINTVVLNPDWRPTAKITRELVAKIRRNPEFLAKEGYEVAWFDGEKIDSDLYQDIDWNEIQASDIKIRQQAGGQNALGHIKFLMPNSNDIYLHDTNSRKLFAKTDRALSHGCIRLGDPMKLAEFVLGREVFEKRNITKKAGKGGSEYINITSIPVYAIYHTAWVDDDGFINIAADIYNKSKKFNQALQGDADELNKLLAETLPDSPRPNRAGVHMDEIATNINPATP